MPKQGHGGRGGLSAEDGRILRLLVAGLHDQEIGAIVGLSEHTVRHHVDELRVRQGASTRAGLGALVQARGLGRLDAADALALAAVKAARRNGGAARRNGAGRRGRNGSRSLRTGEGAPG